LSFYSELKRRNVFKVALVYSAVAWLLLQVSATLGPALLLPDWFVSGVSFLLIIGFPIAIIFAWAFELTPEGLKRDSEPNSNSSETQSSQKLNHAVVAALVLAVGYFIFDRFGSGASRDAAEGAAVVQDAPQQTADIDSQQADNSIAVLPFVNMSSDEEQEYFSDGLSEELLNLLAKIPELEVAARTSSFAYKGKDLEIPEIASRLKVAHVLEGSVRKHDNQLRITAQLIQADSGFHLWSETYDRQLDNVFQIQEEIAVAVVDALKITLLGAAPKTRTTDPVAYQLFLEGQFLKRQLTRDSMLKAIKSFRRAVEIDPEYVPAWAELADTYIWVGSSEEFTRQESHAFADQAIQTAISIDPDYAFAYYVRGISWVFVRQDFRKGIEDFEYALMLEPDNAFMVAAIGKGAYVTGKFRLAISQFKAALELEPVVPEFYWFLAKSYLASGQIDNAEVSFRKLMDLSASPYGDGDFWEVFFLKGEFEAALALTSSRSHQSATFYAMGNIAKADEILDVMIESYGDSSPYVIAWIYGFRDEADKTFEWLGKMLDRGEGFPTFLLGENAFRSVHSDPRWPLFLEKLGLLDFWLERQE
jgi:TolB-like protein/Tfp pilus assembly protein PilF